MATLPELTPPLCERCGAPISLYSASAPCRNCPQGTIHFDCARAVLDYGDERVKQMIYALKFDYYTALAEPLGLLLAGGFSVHYMQMQWDAIVPVPLHKRRQRRREFNQSELIALPFSRQFNLPVKTDILVRTRLTRPQTELTPEQRRENVAGAFSLRPGAAIAGLRLLVVDDVMTTGSTVNEVCSVFKQHGAEAAAVLTLARALLHRPPSHEEHVMEKEAPATP